MTCSRWLAGALVWAVAVPALAQDGAQGLSAGADALAPPLLSVPGETLLIDPPPAAPAPGIELAPEADEVGLASWYGAKFHKRRTASGELFDMKALTAAHPTLPFGSRVCVRSQATGRTVVVRINDRGPFSRGRVIDISHAAARQIGMHRSGTARVKLALLNTD